VKRKTITKKPLTQAELGTVAIGGVVAFGLLYLVFGKKTAAASTTSSSSSSSTTGVPGTIILEPGSQNEIISAAGANITLPPGATWTAQNAGTVAGSNTPIVLPPPTGPSASTTIYMYWTDAGGNAQTTSLTLST
jgi:hypothetical protein